MSRSGSLVAMAGLLHAGVCGHAPVVSVVALTLVATGLLAWLAVFWTLPTAFLSGAAAAGGIAWINSLAISAAISAPT